MLDQVSRELDLDVAPATAWQALTDPESLSRWLADEVQIDCVPGGEARFRTGSAVREGWVEEVSPPQAAGDDPRDDARARLVFWWSHGDQPATRVAIELHELEPGRTRLRIAETRPLDSLELIGLHLPGLGASGDVGPIDGGIRGTGANTVGGGPVMAGAGSISGGSVSRVLTAA